MAKKRRAMPVLNFKGKSIVRTHHLTVPFYPLEINAKKSFVASQTSKPSLEGNLMIHGDNLHALKALIPHYGGKIKCIYIDPPYNTGNENWKYNDNVNNPMIQTWLTESGINKDDMERHDKWLCMMWPRLELLKVLLAEDGVIFISIDDNEQHRLRMILDEIFGEENFVGVMKRRASRKTAHLSKKMSDMCDYIIAYCKNELSAPLGVHSLSAETRPVFNANNSLCIRNIPKGADANCQDGLYKKGEYKVSSMVFLLLDDLEIKDHKVFREVRIKGKFRVNQDIINQTIYITKNFGLRRYVLPEERDKIKAIHDLIDDPRFYNEKGSEEFGNIFSDQKFSHPKPSDLIKFLIKSQQQKDNNNYIILDSFAGSGTTAHAVLDLNKEDGGNRKFILIECEDYANNITAERIRRVIKGIPTAKDDRFKKGLGGSFAYCTLGQEFNEENFLKCKSLPTYNVLAPYIFYTATGEALQKFKKRGDYYVGKTKNDVAIFVVYQPDKEFLRSDASALHAKREALILQTMKVEKCKKAYVFAMACFVPPEDLPQKGLVFCQMPFQIHKMLY